MKCILFLVPTACLLLAAKNPDDDKVLAAALQTAAALESYTFKIDEKPGKGAGTGVEGTFQKDQPVFLKADNIPFFKKGDTLVYKHGDLWRKTKKGIESDPLAILGASAKVNAARLPHEELATLAKSRKSAEKADKKEGGLTVYACELNEETAKKLAPTESQGVAKGGKATFWLNGDEALVKYAIILRLKGRQGNAEVDGTTEKTVTLTDLGKAKIDLPDAAKKALE